MPKASQFTWKNLPQMSSLRGIVTFRKNSLNPSQDSRGWDFLKISKSCLPPPPQTKEESLNSSLICSPETLCSIQFAITLVSFPKWSHAPKFLLKRHSSHREIRRNWNVSRFRLNGFTQLNSSHLNPTQGIRIGTFTFYRKRLSRHKKSPDFKLDSSWTCWNWIDSVGNRRLGWRSHI